MEIALSSLKCGSILWSYAAGANAQHTNTSVRALAGWLPSGAAGSRIGTGPVASRCISALLSWGGLGLHRLDRACAFGLQRLNLIAAHGRLVLALGRVDLGYTLILRLIHLIQVLRMS